MTAASVAAQTKLEDCRRPKLGEKAIRERIARRIFPISSLKRRKTAPDAWARAVVSAGLAAAIGIGLAGCHTGPHLTPQQAEGKQLYDVRCAHCHEYNDLGLKKVPPNLRGIFTRKTLPSGAPATDVQVARTVLAGKGMMPSFAGRFTLKQMEALLAYLHTDMSGPHTP